MNLKIISWNMRGLKDRDKRMRRGTYVRGADELVLHVEEWGLGSTSSVGGLLQSGVLAFGLFEVQWVMPR
jgi:hypothetical protein